MNRTSEKRISTSEHVGKRFGLLTIQRIYVSNRYTLALCKCNCGATKAIRLSHIYGLSQSGQTKSCGCLLRASKLDLKMLVGERFGFLKVHSGRTDGRHLRLLCQCVCGRRKEIRASAIKGIGKAGGTVSCGCKRGHHNKTRLMKESHDAFSAQLKKHGWSLLAFSIEPSPRNKSLVRCPDGHTLDYTPCGFRSSAVHSGQPMCPYCRLEKTLAEANDLAHRKGGKCLSTFEELAAVWRPKKFSGASLMLQWQCSEPHFFPATIRDVRGGHWCPECAQAISERKCRAAFEQLFNRPFPAAVPDFLKTRGREFAVGSTMLKMGRTPLRLDGFCEELKLAFEHHGSQHYFKLGFRRDGCRFRRAALLDILKRRLCRENGITLITIPMLGFHRLADEAAIKPFVREQCRRFDFPVPECFDSTTVDFSAVHKTSYAREQLETFRRRLDLSGRRLVEECWLGGTHKHKIVCSCGRSATAVPFDWEKFSCLFCVSERRAAGFQRSRRISEPVETLICYLENVLLRGETRLAAWARHKIRRLRDKQARRMVKLLPSQCARLDKLGVFDVEAFDNRFRMGSFIKRSNDARWNQRYDELEAFVLTNGHAQPPAMTGLGKWVAEQKRSRNDRQLAQWRCKKLAKLEHWSQASKKPSTPTGLHRRSRLAAI